MSGKVQTFDCGEQGAKLEAFKKSIDGNISEDEKRRQKELEISGRIAQETFNDFKDGKFSAYQMLVNDISNPRLKKLLSTPFMSTLAQGAATVAWTGAAVISEKVDATLFLATSGLAISAAANTVNSLRKTKMARVFGYALKNLFKDLHNTAEKIKRAKNIAEAKKRKEIAEKRKGELEVVDAWGDFIRAQKPQKNSVQQFFCQLKTMVQNKGRK